MTEHGFPENVQEAIENGWEVHGIFPHPNRRPRHGRLRSEGYLSGDFGFTRRGKRVPPGQYVVWKKKIE